jgi:protein SCO1
VGDGQGVRPGAQGTTRVNSRGAWIALSILAAPSPVPSLIAAGPEFAQSPPAPEEGRYVGHPLPDVRVVPAEGRPFRLAESWREKPLLLALVFTRCAGLCSPFLASLAAAQEAVGGRGSDYRTVVLSFDPRDTEADMSVLARRLGLAHAAGWAFGVAEPGDVTRLSAAVGFWFQWDDARQQYDHPGLLVAVEGGRVVRLLLGTRVEAVRLQEVVRELRGELVGAYPLPGRVLVRCFQYRPKTGGLVLDWGFALLLAPAAVALLGSVALFATAGRGRRGSGLGPGAAD